MKLTIAFFYKMLVNLLSWTNLDLIANKKNSLLTLGVVAMVIVLTLAMFSVSFEVLMGLTIGVAAYMAFVLYYY